MRSINIPSKEVRSAKQMQTIILTTITTILSSRSLITKLIWTKRSRRPSSKNLSERVKKVARRRKAARRSAFKEMDRHSIPRLKAACKDKIAQSFEYFI